MPLGRGNEKIYFLAFRLALRRAFGFAALTFATFRLAFRFVVFLFATFRLVVLAFATLRRALRFATIILYHLSFFCAEAQRYFDNCVFKTF